MYNLKVNEWTSKSIDKIYVNSFVSPMPKKIQERVSILGKNGTILIGEKYEDRKLLVNCLLINDDIRGTLRAVLAYLKPDNDVLVSLSIEPNIFYYGRLESLDNYNFDSPTHFKFDLSFIAESEKYEIINEQIDLDSILSIGDIDALTEGVDYSRTIY